ncbi:MAG: methyltransferase domain-containing protein [Bacteroidales bacterium]|nr:methyltransferase domain-containing protein [Bacteroidales bacterium]
MNFGSDNKSALQAKYDAQKIAFGPIMFQAALSLRDLGILEYLKKHKKGSTIEEIAEALNVSVYGVKVLLEAGISLEMVYVKDSKFFITKTGAFVLFDKLTQVNFDFVQDVNYLGFHKLKESIQNGKPEGLKVFGEWPTVYEALSKLPADVQKSWFEFDHYYSDCAFPEILPIVFADKPKKLMDIGGNTGKFSIQCAGYDEDVQVTILDLPGQLEKAYANIEENGYSDRVSGHPINLLDHSNPYPKGHDVIWMSQFLDCFSKEDILELLKRAAEAVNEGGSIYILETYWDNQKFPASTYSLHATSLYFTCLANGCSQMYHTQDMIELVEKAGLFVKETFDDIGVSHTLFKCQKK